MIARPLQVPRPGRMVESPSSVQINKFEPTFVGWFTKDEDGGFRGEDPCFVKYLHLPKNISNVHFNLAKFNDDDEFNFPVRREENIDPLLYWIKANSTDDDGHKKKPAADIICYRNVLANVMKLSYELYDEFFICAIKIEGVLYICEYESDAQKAKEISMDARQLNSAKQGLKFQHFLLSESPNEAPDTTKPFVRDESELDLVLEVKFGDHKLLYASKNKGVPGEDALLDLEKTSFTDIRTSKDSSYKWSQLINWWTTSITGKLDHMIIGLRGDCGLVERLDIVKTPELMKKIQVLKSSGGGRGRGRGFRGRGGYQAPSSTENVESQCFSFLNTFLNYVKENVKKEGVPYQFKWIPQNKDFVNCKELQGEAGNNFQFIPQWFKEWLNSCK